MEGRRQVADQALQVPPLSSRRLRPRGLVRRVLISILNSHIPARHLAGGRKGYP